MAITDQGEHRGASRILGTRLALTLCMMSVPMYGIWRSMEWRERGMLVLMLAVIGVAAASVLWLRDASILGSNVVPAASVQEERSRKLGLLMFVGLGMLLTAWAVGWALVQMI